MEKLKQILVVIATLVTIYVNYLAGIGAIGGITPQIISERYPTFFTPAGYAFSIWGLIYLGLIVFTVFQALPKHVSRLKNIRSAYLVSAIANCVWIFFWHHDHIIASLLTMFVLLGSLVFINVQTINVSNSAERFFVKVPFNIYLGWISVAAIANFSIALVANGVKFSDSVSIGFSCALVTVATLLGIIMRWKLQNFLFSVVIAWALTAIAMNHNKQTSLVLFTAFGVIISLITPLTFFLRDKKSTI